MELLKIRDNRPYKDRRDNNVEFLRDFCCLYFDEELNWEFYLNGEVKKGDSIFGLIRVFSEIIKLKNKGKRNNEISRRLVIWSNSLSLLRNYYSQLDKNLQVSLIEKFYRGRYRRFVDIIYNKDLEFRNFELLAGEKFNDVKDTYGFKSQGVGVMVDFIKKREAQGLKGWGSIRYTAANNNLKLFYRNFTKEQLAELQYENIKRTPSYEFYQVLQEASKAGVIMVDKNTQNKMINNVYSYDISSAYNSQFVRGDDFPIGKVKKIDTSELLRLYNEDKWFLLVMISEVPIDNVPDWLTPYEQNGMYYYIIGNYDYKCLKLMGANLSRISKDWKKHKLFTCEETGRLNEAVRMELNNLYKQRQYLKSIGSKEEKIYKQIAEVLYGKGIQKRTFNGNSEIATSYKQPNKYICAQISYHALQRTRYEIISMLDRLNWSYVACDTDSIKTQNPAAPQLFEERNREILAENQAAGIDSKIGLWKAEGLYPNFIQYGKKVYAYEQDGKIECKFAGCPISAWKNYFKAMSKEEGLNKLQDPSLVIPKGINEFVLKIDEGGKFYLKKVSYDYAVRGGDLNG